MCLRDTAIIQHQHVNALLAASQKVMDLTAALPKDVIALSTMMEGMDNPDMHKYADKMDSKTTSSQRTTIHLISFLIIPLKVTPITCRHFTTALGISILGYQIGIQGMQQLDCVQSFGPCTISSISCELDAHKLEFQISATRPD